MTMSNTIAWVILAAAALVSAVALSAAIFWVAKEDERTKAGIKLVLAALLFVAVIFLLGFLIPIVQL